MKLLTIQSEFWSHFAGIETPLALAGLFAAITFLIAMRVLKNFRPHDPGKRHSFELARTTLKYLFILSLVAMCFGTFGYWLSLRTAPVPKADLTASERKDDRTSSVPKDDLTASEHEAVRLEKEVMIVEAAWENMDHSPADWKKVVEEAPKLADQMLLIEDQYLRPAYRVLKYEYALYAFTMAASAEADREAKLLYISKGLDSRQKGAHAIAEARRNYANNESYRKAVAYVADKNVEDRLNYLTAICFCRKADVTGEAELKRQAKQTLARVSPGFLRDYPIEGNQEFDNCVTVEGGGAK